MMKKFLSLLLCLCLLLSLTACGGKAEQTGTTTPSVPEETTETEPAYTSSPLLYRVTDSEGNTVYLLGSIHVGTYEMYPLPDYVMDAYNTSDALAVEIDLIAAAKDMSGAVESLQLMLLTDGTTITDHISEDVYEQAVEILKDNHSYTSAYDSFMPVLWYSLISGFAYEQAGADADLGVDMHFLELAHDEDKTIYEIESAQEQYAVLAGLDMALQVYLLESVVAGYDAPETEQELLGMCAAWAKGDADGLLAQTEGDVSEDEAALYSEFNASLEGQRNINMTSFAMEALASGETVFIVVGAAHVIGDDGMAARLAQAGYTVEQLS